MKRIASLFALVPLCAAVPVALAFEGAQDRKDDKKEEGEKPKPVEIGAPVPQFELQDLEGKTVKLSDYKDKIVVLEWFNPQCPAVIVQHGSGPLKDMASKVTGDKVVWLAVNSGGPGKQGHDVEVNRKMREEWKMNHPILRDEKGDLGRRLGAKTTPHMFVIDAKGNLAYRGAPDNAPNGQLKEGEELVNFVDAAIRSLKEGKPVEVAETKAYG